MHCSTSSKRSTGIWALIITALAATLAVGCGRGDESSSHHGAGDSAGAHGAHGEGGHGAHGGHDDSGTGAHTHTTRLEFASEPAAIEAGKPATWRLRVLDAKSGQPVPEFSLSHEKLMHLIVVSSDLSWFNHIHPEYAGNGEFVVTATLPRAGSYKLYADYTPKGGSQEVAQHKLATAGAASSATMQESPNEPGTGGWMIRETVSRPEGEPEAAGGATYQVAMMPMPSKLVAGKDAMLHFQVRDAAGKPLTDLEPYLGALGHAVLLSSDTKTYLHTHPMEEGADHSEHGAMGHGGDSNGAQPATTGGGESDVIFHTNFPTPGLYKVWGQFQHKGRIITAAYVLRVS